MVGGFGGWAVSAQITGAVIASGLIEVDQNRQVVQHLDGGVVTEILVDEGDVIDLGDAAYQVLHLPGHSPGSIGLFDVKRKVLFSGDALYDGELLDSLYHSDLDIYAFSIFGREKVHSGDNYMPSYYSILLADLLRRTMHC